MVNVFVNNLGYKDNIKKRMNKIYSDFFLKELNRESQQLCC